ncbi:DUF6464 family protein [Parathermosynechococcus lividus]
MASPTDLPAELHLIHPERSLGQVQLDWVPQPGCRVDHDGETYTVLERRHRYQFRGGRYHLHKVALYVQLCNPEAGDRHLVAGQWVIGDVSCQWNAQSPLLRCAVNPKGPCETCQEYHPRDCYD